MRFIVSFILFSVHLCSAQVPDSQKTWGQLNCRFWNSTTEGNRPYFIGGYVEAYTFFVSGTEAEKIYRLPNATIGEIAKGVTNVCAKPENGRILIWHAISAFRDLANGATPEDVEQGLVSARKMTLPVKEKN
jgi:hypothetical protein